MKKTILFLFILVSCWGFSQISVFEAKRTKDVTAIQKFIQDNPNHPAVPELKQRIAMLQSGNPATMSSTTTPKIPAAPASGIGTKAGSAEQSKKTADLLTNLFSSDPNKKEAILQVVNKSKCPLSVNINGKKNYTLSVPANGQNYILVAKGTYTIATSVCGAPYNKSKDLTQNVVITLNSR